MSWFIPPTLRKLALGAAILGFSVTPVLAAGGGGGHGGGGGGGHASGGGGGGGYHGGSYGGGAYHGGGGAYYHNGGGAYYHNGGAYYHNGNYYHNGYGYGGWGYGPTVIIGGGYGGWGYSDWGYGYAASPVIVNQEPPVAYTSGYSPDPGQPSLATTLPVDGGSVPPTSAAQTNPSTPPPAPVENAAHVRVKVPANAEVWLSGDKSKQTGAVRDFVSPPLTPGEHFAYRVRARWTGPDGKVFDETRKIPVMANDWRTVDFTLADPTSVVPNDK